MPLGCVASAVIALGVPKIFNHQHCQRHLAGIGTERDAAAAREILGNKPVVFGLTGLGAVLAKIVVTTIDRDASLTALVLAVTREVSLGRAIARTSKLEFSGTVPKNSSRKCALSLVDRSRQMPLITKF